MNEMMSIESHTEIDAASIFALAKRVLEQKIMCTPLTNLEVKYLEQIVNEEIERYSRYYSEGGKHPDFDPMDETLYRFLAEYYEIDLRTLRHFLGSSHESYKARQEYFRRLQDEKHLI